MNNKGLVISLILIFLFLYNVSISAAYETYSFTPNQTISGNGSTGSCTTDGTSITPASADPVFSAFYSNYSTPSGFSTDKCYTHLVDGTIGMGYSPVDGGALMRLSATAPFNIQSVIVFPKTSTHVWVNLTRAGPGEGTFTTKYFEVVPNQWNTLTMNFINVSQLDFYSTSYSLAELYFQDFILEKYIPPVINRYVYPSAGANVSISPSTTQTVADGTQATFTVTPSANYTASVSGTCGGVLVGTTYTTAAVTANCTVIASATPSTYNVTPSAGANVSISPSTPQTVVDGTQATFTVTPSANYTASVSGTCGGVLVGTTYTTAAVTANCTVIASATLTNTVNPAIIMYLLE